jgi:hypothetical protein
MREIENCEVHVCATHLQTIPVVASAHTGMKDSPTYVIARRERFPNSDDVLPARGVWRDRQNAEVAVCQQCCADRDSFIRTQYPRWLLTHEIAS